MNLFKKKKAKRFKNSENRQYTYAFRIFLNYFNGIHVSKLRVTNLLDNTKPYNVLNEAQIIMYFYFVNRPKYFNVIMLLFIFPAAFTYWLRFIIIYH